MVNDPPDKGPELPPNSLGGLFPFFIDIDADFSIRALGRSLQRACPNLQVGIVFDQAFASVRPDPHISLDRMRAGVSVLRVLQEKQSAVLLRGQCLATDDGGVLFLGSPWLSDTSALNKLNLSVEDFAIHDPAVDLLHILRSQKMATDDLRRLTDKLKSQRTQLKETNTRLVSQEAETRRLAMIVERTDNAVVLADPQGRTQWVNAGFTRLTGYTLEEVLGRIPGEVLQGPGTDPETVAYMRSKIRAQESFRAEIVNYNKSGRRYWVSFEVQPIFGDDGELVNYMAIENDTTAKRASNAELRAQFRISQLLATDLPFEDVAYELIEVIGTELEWDIAVLWIQDPEDGQLHRFKSWAREANIHDQFFAAAPAEKLTEEESVPGLAWKSQSAQWIEKLERYLHVPRSAAIHQAGFISSVATPIRMGERALGAIELVSQWSTPFAEDRLRVLTAMGSQIAQFVQRSDSQQKLQQRSEELLQLNRELAEASKAKDEFLASVSHEIRTPLNGVIGAADAIMGTSLDPEQREALETIGSSASHLHSLLNDVLDISRIEAGQLSLSPEATTISNLIEDTVSIFRPIARQKRLAFIIDAPVPAELTVSVDATRLRQVLVNLLGNAFKFTQEGEVKLILRLEQSGRTVKLDFRIQDTGIGIPTDRVDQLFKPFSQLDSSRTRRFGGTGLGLAISRQLINMMAGRLELEATPPPGCSFRITLTTDQVERPHSKSPDHVRFTPGEDVLVVDDNSFNAQVMQMLMRRLGLSTHHCFNGIDALAYCAEKRPPVILMDLHMPDMDGIEATQKLRKYVFNPEQPRIPIIALTADARPEVRESCLAAGMDDFLTKPIRLGDLRTTLVKYLPVEGAELDLPTGNESHGTTGLDLAIADAFYGEAISEEDRLELREMFDAMWQDIEPSMVKIKEQQARGNIAEGQALCHGLLGVLANFGFEGASALLRRMEQSEAEFMNSELIPAVRRSAHKSRSALLSRYPYLDGRLH